MARCSRPLWQRGETAMFRKRKIRKDKKCRSNKQRDEHSLNAHIVAICLFSARHAEQKSGKAIY
jgi:hypothetical protein